MDIKKAKAAYKFAIEQCQKTFGKNKIAYEHFTVFAALAHFYLLQEGADADLIIDEILGEDEECTE